MLATVERVEPESSFLQAVVDGLGSDTEEGVGLKSLWRVPCSILVTASSKLSLCVCVYVLYYFQ